MRSMKRTHMTGWVQKAWEGAVVSAQSLKPSPTLTPQKTASTSTAEVSQCFMFAVFNEASADCIKHQASSQACRYCNGYRCIIAKARVISGILSLCGVSRW